MTDKIAEWVCENCGWVWPLASAPPMGAECDSCGGALIESSLVSLLREWLSR